MEFTNLSFGAEVEFTGLTRNAAIKVISSYFGNTLIDHVGGGYDTYQTSDPIFGRLWKIEKDSSIRTKKKIGTAVVSTSDLYSCELVTPPLYYQDIEKLQEIIRKLKEAGALSDPSCGIHIHVGANTFNAKHLIMLCNVFFSKQQLIYSALKINQQRERYCKMYSEEFIKTLNSKKPTTLADFKEIWYNLNSTRFESISNHYNSSRYHGLNLHNLLGGRQETIEYRLFNGTLHAGQIKAYIQFCLLFTANALNSTKASFKVTVPSTGNYKYSFRVFLLHLGMIGEEFKTARFHLLKYLDGNTAWRDRQ